MSTAEPSEASQPRSDAPSSDDEEQQSAALSMVTTRQLVEVIPTPILGLKVPIPIWAEQSIREATEDEISEFTAKREEAVKASEEDAKSRAEETRKELRDEALKVVTAFDEDETAYDKDREVYERKLSGVESDFNALTAFLTSGNRELPEEVKRSIGHFETLHSDWKQNESRRLKDELYHRVTERFVAELFLAQDDAETTARATQQSEGAQGDAEEDTEMRDDDSDATRMNAGPTEPDDEAHVKNEEPTETDSKPPA